MLFIFYCRIVSDLIDKMLFLLSDGIRRLWTEALYCSYCTVLRLLSGHGPVMVLFYIVFLCFFTTNSVIKKQILNLCDQEFVEYKNMESYLSILLRTREISVQGFIRMSQKSTT